MGAYMGAEELSNNTGELSALLAALLHAEKYRGYYDSLTIVYDSKYAALAALGVNKGVENQVMIQRIRHKLMQLSYHFHIFFKHVRGHSGNELNEIADFMACEGAQGHVRCDFWHENEWAEKYRPLWVSGKQKAVESDKDIKRSAFGLPLVKQFRPIDPIIVETPATQAGTAPPAEPLPMSLRPTVFKPIVFHDLLTTRKAPKRNFRIPNRSTGVIS